MPDVVKNDIALFADDAKLFSGIDNKEDHDNLQQYLIRLQNWSREWQLNFNAQKCKVLHLGRNNPNQKNIF